MKSVFICEKCRYEQFAVVDSRKNDIGIIIRKKKCANCGHKIATYEMDKSDFDEITNFPQNLMMFKDVAKRILEL